MPAAGEGWLTNTHHIISGVGPDFPLIVQYNTLRTHLHFYAIGNTLPLSTYQAVNEYGYLVIPPSVSTALSLTTHGPMVYGPWYLGAGVACEIYVIEGFSGGWQPPGGQSLREVNEAVKKQCAVNRGAVQVRESVLQRLHNASNSVRRSAGQRINRH